MGPEYATACELPIGKPHEDFMWVDNFFRADCEAAEDLLRKASERQCMAKEAQAAPPAEPKREEVSPKLGLPSKERKTFDMAEPRTSTYQDPRASSNGTPMSAQSQTPLSALVSAQSQGGGRSSPPAPLEARLGSTGGLFGASGKFAHVDNTEVSSSEDEAGSVSDGADHSQRSGIPRSASLRSKTSMRRSKLTSAPSLRISLHGRDLLPKTKDEKDDGCESPKEKDCLTPRRMHSRMHSLKKEQKEQDKDDFDMSRQSCRKAVASQAPREVHDGVRELCVECEVISARELGAGQGKKLNPFCEVKLRSIDADGVISSSHSNPQKSTTRAISNTSSPVWKEVFWYNLPVADCLRVSVFSKKTLGTKTFLGHVNITASQLLSVLSPGGPPMVASYPCTPDPSSCKRATVTGSVELSLRLVCLKH
eukprot:TRINITY_DN14913_c0_g1_i1.p1 TRINITY_DN14913_c0_g1~~TRINITY_DN14913_c0_g1_i1.p1  ORF type:complete len:441 (+),score=132.44 TRINITY_DN14913_c0_g1_i1:55-1323(+)